MEQIKRFYPKNKEEWRAWLKKNHERENKIALIRYKKHTGKPSLTHKEAMNEAICFGWIDTTIKRLDEEKYIINFVKRNEKSRWSNATLSYAKRLRKEKKMSPQGIKFYKEGLKKPVIDHGLPKNPEISKELKEEFEKKKNKKARENFNNFAPSYKRTYIYWIERAKLPETRKKRARAVLQRAKENNKNFL